MWLSRSSSAMLRLGILLSLLLRRVFAELVDNPAPAKPSTRSTSATGTQLVTISATVTVPKSKSSATEERPKAKPTAAPAAPKIKRTQFDNQLSDVLYFDDSTNVLVTDKEAGIAYLSTDEGTSWDRIKDLAKGEVFQIFMHPHDNKAAVALGIEQRHWITQNRGKSWREFETEKNPAMLGAPLSFHAEDPDKIILNTRDFQGGETVYTTDGFKTIKTLREKTVRCLWAKEQDRLYTGDKTSDKMRTLCIVEGKYSEKQAAFRLLISNDYFEDGSEFEPKVEEGRSVSGILSMVAVKGYIVAARQSEGTDEMALYTTTDTNTWHRAHFSDEKLKEGGYTIMESTNYSLQVDAMSGSVENPMGVLFTSNSNGTYFTRNEDYTNRNKLGFVDFEKIQGIQGIVLVNTVANWEDVLDKNAPKKLISQISFDDGRTFQDLKAGTKKLHLHSVTNAQNSGKVFSSLAPGLAMGIGNTGDYLHKYTEGDLYVSDDAGEKWNMALKGAHKYEFGDSGSVLLAVYEDPENDKMMYSLNHGKDWTQFELDTMIRAQLLTTIPDSTSLKFILMATTGSPDHFKHWIYSIDFENLELRKCKTKDFEDWYARADANGKPTCIMGHTQTFRRRKADANCFVDEEFKDPMPINDNEDCECTPLDFECDSGFERSKDRKECIPTGPIEVPEGKCKDSSDTYMGRSGFRLIPGNDCRKKGGVNMDEPVERQCSATARPKPTNGTIDTEITFFPSEGFREYYYLERKGSSSGEDETVVMLTQERHLYITHDHGKTWSPSLEDEEILAIYPNRNFNDAAYFITPSKKVFYTKSRGKSMHSFDAPGRPNNVGLQIMRFHPKNMDWLLWTTCAEAGSPCQPWTYVTTKNGDDWNPLLKSVDNCEFMWKGGLRDSEKLVYCVHHPDEDIKGNKQLVSSEDWFEHRIVHFEDMLNFATMSEFIIVATKDDADRQFLKVESSIDGTTFADARFPSNFQVLHQSAYTVLDSSTHAVFLHVTVNESPEQEYGSIIKSNSNGTSYVMSINGVNRNSAGYVDFEKMLGLEGVAVVNVVDNINEAQDGSAKKLKTMITHNDGAEWSYLSPPETDSEGKSYDCPKDQLAICSLHLHGYTERKDPRDTYSSPSAVGLMMGIGNVGSYLGRYKTGDTFITRDGGVTWVTAKKGQYMWEYGDSGSVIVIVQELTPTNVVYYSTDEGDSWTEFVFHKDRMAISDITTVPSDNSRNFLLWGHDTTSREKAITVNLDFSGLTDKRCNLDREHPDSPESDYYLYEPKHPLQEDNCLFGHVSQYYRKKRDRNCYNGPMNDLGDRLHGSGKNCSCTRQDFECDYNYERQIDGTCKLVPGLKPKDPMQICTDDKNAYEYYEVTGYRRIQISTCQGGDMQYTSRSHPCPGKEREYRNHKGLSGAGLFFAIVIPIAVACAAGYWVFRNWESKFGRIRLGDAAPGFDANGKWLTVPIMVVSAVTAGVMAVPMVVGVVYRSVRSGWTVLRERFGRRGGGGAGGGAAGTGSYTSRGSFGRGRSDYAAVGNDESDLLGEESDEDV